MTKRLQTKSNKSQQRYGKAQRSDSPKKSASKATKGKKADGTKKTPKKQEQSRIAWWHSLRQYLREVVYELRKVVWPSRKETIGSTSVVLIIVIISGIFLGIVDFILSRFVRLLIG